MNQKKSFQLSSGATINFCWCPPGAMEVEVRRTSLFRFAKSETATVVSTKGFWISEVPVTIAQWNTILGKDDFTAFVNKNVPVFGIDHREATSFMQEINTQLPPALSTGFSLPNFLEWQYACEARTTTTQEAFLPPPAQFDQYAWFKDNAGGKVQPVASKLPNPWGIYDMYGNILEISVDVDVEAGCKDGVLIDPRSKLPDDAFTIQGGSFMSAYEDCKCSNRTFIASENSFVQPLGIRLLYREG